MLQTKMVPVLCGCAFFFGIAELTPELCAQAAFGPPVTTWADWTSDNATNSGGSVSGTLVYGSSTLNVTYSGEVFNQTQLNGAGTDYYTPLSTYTNSVVNTAPVSGMITLAGGTGGTADTITFSGPVSNPVMAIVSEGSDGENLDLSFNVPFTILSSGPGWWGSGAALTQTGNVLHGAESDGSIQFSGVVTSISWTVNGSDGYYTGLTIGATNGMGPAITNISGGNAIVFQGEPWSLAASGMGDTPLTYQWLFNSTNLVNTSRVYGAQSNVLSFTNLLTNDTGTYELLVSNSYGIATSNVTLTVLPTYNVFNNYAQAVTNITGLLGYWRFDPVYGMNSCVNGYTGTAEGNAQIGATGSGCPIYADPYNMALLLNGNGSYVGTSLTGQIGNTGTMLAWVYLTEEPSSAGRIFSVVNQSDSGNNYDIQIETDNLTRFYAGNGTAVYGTALPLNQWHFLAGTMDGTSNRLYLDGALVASASGSGHTATGNPASIGESQVFTGRFFQGRIDEVAYYNTVLTPAQIESLYQIAADVPALKIAPAQDAVVVSWAINLAGYILQTNSTLASANWAPVPATNGVVGTNYVVTNNVGNPQLFYRLKN